MKPINEEEEEKMKNLKEKKNYEDSELIEDKSKEKGKENIFSLDVEEIEKKVD